MAIKTNHSTETLTPESGVLNVDSSGALKLPTGNTAQRPTGIQGYVRFAENDSTPEYYDGTEWKFFADKEYVNSQISSTATTLSLNDLTDVTVSSPADGQAISYDITSGQFVSQSQSLSPISKFFIADGINMNFDIEVVSASLNNLVVSINGIQQEPYYSYILIDGHIVAFDEPPELGDRIQVKILYSNKTTDRPRPRITAISYGVAGVHTTITINGIGISYGMGVRIGGQSITRIDYPTANSIQLMIETSRMSGVLWLYPQDLTLIDSSGNEFSFKALINYGALRPHWKDSVAYIGTFSAGEAINFPIAVNNAVSITIGPAYAGESALTWLRVDGLSIKGTAPNNSSPTRYEITVTATNSGFNTTKNYWLLVI